MEGGRGAGGGRGAAKAKKGRGRGKAAAGSGNAAVSAPKHGAGGKKATQGKAKQAKATVKATATAQTRQQKKKAAAKDKDNAALESSTAVAAKALGTLKKRTPKQQQEAQAAASTSSTPVTPERTARTRQATSASPLLELDASSKPHIVSLTGSGNRQRGRKRRISDASDTTSATTGDTLAPTGDGDNVVHSHKSGEATKIVVLSGGSASKATAVPAHSVSTGATPVTPDRAAHVPAPLKNQKPTKRSGMVHLKSKRQEQEALASVTTPVQPHGIVDEKQHDDQPDVSKIPAPASTSERTASDSSDPKQVTATESSPATTATAELDIDNQESKTAVGTMPRSVEQKPTSRSKPLKQRAAPAAVERARMSSDVGTTLNQASRDQATSVPTADRKQGSDAIDRTSSKKRALSAQPANLDDRLNAAITNVVTEPNTASTTTLDGGAAAGEVTDIAQLVQPHRQSDSLPDPTTPGPETLTAGVMTARDPPLAASTVGAAVMQAPAASPDSDRQASSETTGETVVESDAASRSTSFDARRQFSSVLQELQAVQSHAAHLSAAAAKRSISSRTGASRDSQSGGVRSNALQVDEQDLAAPVPSGLPRREPASRQGSSVAVPTKQTKVEAAPGSKSDSGGTKRPHLVNKPAGAAQHGGASEQRHKRPSRISRSNSPTDRSPARQAAMSARKRPREDTASRQPPSKKPATGTAAPVPEDPEPPRVSYGIIMDSADYVRRMMQGNSASASQQALTPPPSSEQNLVARPANAWGASFGLPGVPKREVGSRPRALSARPLSSWFLSKGAANFVQRVSFSRDKTLKRQQEFGLSSPRRSSLMGNISSLPVSSSPLGKRGQKAASESNPFMASLTANSAWRTWFRNDQTWADSVLDPEPTNIPKALQDHTVTPMELLPSDDSNVSQESDAMDAGGFRRVEALDQLEQDIRREKLRSREFDRQLLLLLQGKAASGRDFEDEYRSALPPSRS